MNFENVNVALLIGEGATVSIGSDSYPYTIIDVSESGKTIYLREDKVERTDSNGMSEIQEYKYSPNLEGQEIKATKRKNGAWKTTGDNRLVSIGVRRRYYDFSF
jgi:hypothetical protein